MIRRAMARGRIPVGAPIALRAVFKGTAVLAFAAGLRCVTGCADEPATTTAVLFDSAGITVAASPTDVLSGLRPWRLARPPRVVIGDREDDREHRLSEVIGAALLPNGTILVGDGGSRELRLFDAGGRTMRVFGGEGPGELPALRKIAVLAGDTIAASAGALGPVSRFSPDGIFLGSTPLGPFRPGIVCEILHDGSLLFDLYDRGYEDDIETWAVSGMQPLFHPRGWLVRVFPDGRQYTLREVGGQQWFKTGEPGEDLWWAPLPFGPTSAVAVAGSRLYVGSTERAEIEVLSLRGELRGLVRWGEAPVPVTDLDRDQVRETALAALREPARRSHLERWLDEVPYPAYKPAFSALFADRAGRLWIQAPTRARALFDRWIVFDVDGHSLASLEAPAGSRFLDVGEDFALLAQAGSAGGELVKLYDLEK